MLGDPQSALASASPYLRLFGQTLGGACLAKMGLAAHRMAREGDASETARIGVARFYAEKVLPTAPGLARVVASGAGPLQDYEKVLADSA